MDEMLETHERFLDQMARIRDVVYPLALAEKCLLGDAMFLVGFPDVPPAWYVLVAIRYRVGDDQAMCILCELYEEELVA